MSILASTYPLLKMDSLCRGCHGNPKLFIQREKCLMCKRNHAEWVRKGYDNEIKHYMYLREVWLKAKRFNQQSTGLPSLDACIVYLFGLPTEGFGAEKPIPMPKKVAVHTPEYVQGPIHLNLTGREKRKLNYVF